MVFGPFDQQFLCFSAPSEPVPSSEDHERDDVGQYELQQDDAVIPIAPPKLRLLLDAPQPFEAPTPHCCRGSFERPSLKINNCTDESGPKSSGAHGFAAAMLVLFLLLKQ